jgi:hypothetical protein
MTLNNQIKDLINELNAEVSRELAEPKVFYNFDDARDYAKVNLGVLVRSPHNQNEWLVKLPVKTKKSFESSNTEDKNKPPTFLPPTITQKQEIVSTPVKRENLSSSPTDKKDVQLLDGKSQPLSNRPCTNCGHFIPKARLEIKPNTLRCVPCQSKYEKVVDTSRKVVEGFGGNRDEVRKMKAKQWGEMVNRGGSIGSKKRKK